MVESTPVRKASAPGSFLRVAAAEDYVPPSSPLVTRKSTGSQLLGVPLSAVRSRPTETRTALAYDSDAGLFETPVKSKAVKLEPDGPLFHSRGDLAGSLTESPVAAPSGPKSKSIYERLGWDDDF